MLGEISAIEATVAAPKEPAVEEDDGIDVATADEDPLDNLLNTVAQFQGCLENDGFEFIGAPGQPGPAGQTD